MERVIPTVLLVLFVSGYLLYHFRGRPRPSGIASLAELKLQLMNSRFTIVQFYAPL